MPCLLKEMADSMLAFLYDDVVTNVMQLGLPSKQSLCQFSMKFLADTPEINQRPRPFRGQLFTCDGNPSYEAILEDDRVHRKSVQVFAALLLRGSSSEVWNRSYF